MSEQTTYRKIAGAENYAIGSDDLVVNVNTGQKLTKFWMGKYYATRVVDDHGHQRWVNHNYCNVTTTDELPDQEMVDISGYPDYKVTPWGAVWKYRNLPRKRRNSPFILTVKEMKGSDYVRLTSDEGKRHWVRVNKIMEEAYPND